MPLPFALTVLIGVWLAFSRIDLAWMVIAAVAALLIVLLGVVLLGFVSTQSAKDILALSVAANARLKKFVYYYMYPGTSSGLSRSCFYVQVAGVIVAVIGAFDGFWWGIAFVLLLLPIMSIVGYRYNPTLFFLKEGEQQAHEEILSFLKAEMDKRRSAV